MNPKAIFIAALCAATLCHPIHAQDVEGASDHPVVGRYEGTIITDYEALDYDSQTLFTQIDPEGYAEFEGAVRRIVYTMPEAEGASVLQVARSFEQTLADEGFELVLTCKNRDCGKGLFSGGLRDTIWSPLLKRVGALSSNELAVMTFARETVESSSHIQVTIASGSVGSGINLNVVESAAFENKMLDAAAMAKSISETGRVSVDNIYFDFNEATLTDESDAALAEMARLLNNNPDINVYIVGHTDNVGSYEFNLDLSRRRAQSVADALVGQQGIESTRVVPAGVGPLAPIASNQTSDGQAQNRRVEIVQR